MTVPETHFATGVDGVHIAYQVTGDGDLDLVLMHGAVAHLEMGWEDRHLRRLYERLEGFVRLIRFDRRGMGMSDGLSELPTFDQQVADWGAVLDAAGSERASLMGTIDAGTLALAFAAAQPERVSSVVAFETAPRYTRTGEDDFGIDPQVLGRLIEANRAIDTDAALSIVAPDRRDEPGFRSWFRRYSRAASSGIQLEAFGMMINTWDITELVPRIEMPVLVLHKAGHTILPIRNGHELAATLPDARLVELPGTGTTIFSNDVDDIADEIEAFLTGTRPPARRDRVLSTVLFTDIVGSTERAAALGDRDWRTLLERHHGLLRATLDRHAGHEVHTAGDGFLATFDAPRRAIECAQTASEDVRSIGLEIRAGVHTGEIELSDGDVQGLAVHIGARISALAGPGQVLVSSTVKDIVVGSGIEFREHGEHELKGVPGTWRVYEAVSPLR